MKMHYAIVARPGEVSKNISMEVRQKLLEHDYTENEEHPEVVFVIGGDGTFIYAIHKYLSQLDRVSFYGIHTGTLGFYSDYHDGDLEEFLDVFLKKEYTISEYPLLEAITDERKYYALNEIRVENPIRTQEMKISINDELFEIYRGTGICISSQWGSTAYNRSLGGAAVQDGLKILQMVEVAGIHHNKYRSFSSPLIMKASTKIGLQSDQFTDALIGVDSAVYQIDRVHNIAIKLSTDKIVRLIRGRDVSYFERLQSLF